MYILCRAETACGAKDSHRGEWGSRHGSRAETLQRRPRLRPGQSSPRWPGPLWWHLYFLRKQRHHVRTLISIYTLLHNLYVVHSATSDWSRLSLVYQYWLLIPYTMIKFSFDVLGFPPVPKTTWIPGQLCLETWKSLTVHKSWTYLTVFMLSSISGWVEDKLEKIDLNGTTLTRGNTFPISCFKYF